MEYEQRRRDAAWDLSAADDTRIWEYTPRTAHSGQDTPPQSNFYTSQPQDAQWAQAQADLMNSSGEEGQTNEKAQSSTQNNTPEPPYPDVDRWSQRPL